LSSSFPFVPLRSNRYTPRNNNANPGESETDALPPSYRTTAQIGDTTPRLSAFNRKEKMYGPTTKINLCANGNNKAFTMARRCAAVVIVAAMAVGTQTAQAQNEDKNFLDRLGDKASDVFNTVTSGNKLEKAKEVPVETDEYGKTLHGGYMELSESEFHKGDYVDSDRYAERAMAAARDEPTEPEQIAARELRAELLNDLASARRRIVVAEFRGAKGTAPVKLAEAQVSYECWMEEQEEDFQSDDIAACRDKFFVVIASVEDSLKLDVKPEPIAADPIRFDVFFEFDSAELSPLAVTLIREIVTSMDLFRKPLITVTGHADQSGDENYNFELAKKRAQAVADTFNGLGITVAGVYSFGEEAPLVKRQDSAPEEVNRRVIIVMREDLE
jgi:OOP family OmpA-OmpF porin